MFLLERLPSELICHVLSFFPCQDLRALRLTSKFWNDFIKSNDSSTYHYAAIQHSFVPSVSTSLEDALVGQGGYLHGVDSWQALCQRRYTMEANWAHRGYHSLQMIADEHPDVCRIKVDEERGFVVTTHDTGGLVVRDMDTGEVLWSLPQTYVHTFAHCEYSNGFLVFDRLGSEKEVWRLAAEYDHSPHPADEFQEAIAFTINTYPSTSKGHFKPWAMLLTPALGRAFRLVYPVLLVASLSTAYLFDVESANLIQTIQDTQPIRDGESLGNINYVELSPLHVFICGSCQLRIFERGSGSLLYHFSSTSPQWDCVQVAVDSYGTSNQHIPHHKCLVAPVRYHQVDEPGVTRDSMFDAVHVSPDGRTMVALMNDCRLLVVKDVVRLIKGETTLRECAIMVHLTCPKHKPSDAVPFAVYLAFEYGRVGVITTDGVFVITLDATAHSIDGPWLRAYQSLRADATMTEDCPYPNMIICRIFPFTKKNYLERVSCLQMTRSRMFFTWHPSAVTQWPPRSETPEALRTTNDNDATDTTLQDIDADDLLQDEEELFIFDDDDDDFGEDELWTIGAETPFGLLDRLRDSRAKAVAYLDFTPAQTTAE